MVDPAVLPNILLQTLKPHIQHLIDCRPHSIAMGNAIKWLRGQVHGLKREAQAEEAKRKIMDAIETYITERITFAAETLARCANEKVRFCERVSHGNLLPIDDGRN